MSKDKNVTVIRRILPPKRRITISEFEVGDVLEITKLNVSKNKTGDK